MQPKKSRLYSFFAHSLPPFKLSPQTTSTQSTNNSPSVTSVAVEGRIGILVDMSGFLRSLGIFLIGGALILLIFTSISVPYLFPLNVAEVDVSSGSLTVCRNDECDTLVSSAKKLVLGVWGYCAEDANGERTCTGAGECSIYNFESYPLLMSGWQLIESAYELIFKSNSDSISIAKSWTRGLVIHPIG